MKLEELYQELGKNSNAIRSIEIEIERLISAESLDETLLLYNSSIPEMKIYALKIIEERIKRKKQKNINLDLEILTMKNIIYINKSDKTAEVFATLGMYEWPRNFPDFFQIIIDLLSNKDELGYKILYYFMHSINYSQEINEKRKSELKKALRIIYKGYMQLFEDDFASYIIPILTESLKILPKDCDYSIIFRKGTEFPDKTIEFINEMDDLIKIEDVIDLSTKMPVHIGLLIYFNSVKTTGLDINRSSKMYEYIYKGLRLNVLAFLVSIEFWVKFFGLKNKEQFVDRIFSEVLSIYINLNELEKSEVESEVHGFFNVVIKNYPEIIFEFIKKNGDRLPRKLGLYFIKKLHDSLQKSDKLVICNFADLKFQDFLLYGIVLELNNDPRVIEILQYLDFTDKDNAKLVIKIINKFKLSEVVLNQIIEKSHLPGKEIANEVIVECCLQLDKIESFENNWDKDKFIRFFYYLKRVPEKVVKYAPFYLSAFKEKSPFDRCFAILKMLGNFPQEIYEKIYNDIYRYPYEDLNCFNRDLLIFLQLQDPFIKREITRIIDDWNTLDDTNLVILCTKSLLSVFSEGIKKANLTNNTYESINSLFDLLHIDDSGIIRKVCEIFCTYNNLFDVRKALYFFLLNYNSSFVESSHLNIAAAITKCIKAESGSEALHDILNGVPLENCNNLRNELLKSNTKRGQALVRNFLQSFKAKPLNTLYANNFRVQEQNFIDTTVKPHEGFNFKIDRTFFG